MGQQDQETIRFFFALLRAGLWGIELDKEKYEGRNLDWDTVLQIAKKQTVVGIVADGISSLPATLTSNSRILGNWVPLVLNIEEQNRRVNVEVVRQAELFDRIGLPFILLKGQGCASFYPNPLHRQCGDIDVYIGLDRSEEIKKCIVEEGYQISYENRIHFCYNAKETSVECHKLAHHFCCPWLNSAFQRIAIKELQEENPSRFECDGRTIAIPNDTFNAFYLFIHFFEHFYHEGVGLRQLCDWALLMKKSEDKIDWDKVYQYVRKVHALRAWRTFYAIAKRFLGLCLKQETESLPLFTRKAKERDIRFVMNDIFSVGNMGKYGAEAKAFRAKKQNKSTLHPYIYRVARIIYLIPFFPEEKICHPLWALCNVFGLVKR